MKNAHKLSSDSEYYKSIGVKHDMSKEKRLRDKELKELKREARNRTENDTENFT